MRSQHHHRHAFLHGWHADQRERRRPSRWIPCSLRWKGGIFTKIVPQILFSGLVALVVRSASNFLGDELSLHSPILFPIFGYIHRGPCHIFSHAGSYSRCRDGRIQWDRLSTLSRSFARTVWIHIPEPVDIDVEEELSPGKRLAIQCPHMLAVALKHHLRDERGWDSCTQLRDLLSYLPDYPYSAMNHPLILTLYMSPYVEHVRLTTTLDPQVYTHLLSQVEALTAVVSACERLLRTPIPLGYNIAISRIVWIFIIALPSQLWRELRWWSISVTMLTAYALFALAEVGLEIENPWGEGPNDLDLDRYCNLLALDLEEIVSFKPQPGWFSLPKSVFATPGATTPTLDIKNSFTAVGAEYEEAVDRRLLL